MIEFRALPIARCSARSAHHAFTTHSSLIHHSPSIHHARNSCWLRAANTRAPTHAARAQGCASADYAEQGICLSRSEGSCRWDAGASKACADTAQCADYGVSSFALEADQCLGRDSWLRRTCPLSCHAACTAAGAGFCRSADGALVPGESAVECVTGQVRPTERAPANMRRAASPTRRAACARAARRHWDMRGVHQRQRHRRPQVPRRRRVEWRRPLVHERRRLRGR
jgi:hypothetical protein